MIVTVALLGSATWLVIGWALHYLPFYGNGSSALLSSLLPGANLQLNAVRCGAGLCPPCGANLLTLRKSGCLRTTGSWVAIFQSFCTVSTCSHLLPTAWTVPSQVHENSTMHGLRWLDTWEF
ncbi:hypothetical protein MRX96_048596 [Rhipicephalus microplus]